MAPTHIRCGCWKLCPDLASKGPWLLTDTPRILHLSYASFRDRDATLVKVNDLVVRNLFHRPLLLLEVIGCEYLVSISMQATNLPRDLHLYGVATGPSRRLHHNSNRDPDRYRRQQRARAQIAGLCVYRTPLGGMLQSH